jgi:hypothetical protein
MSANAFAHWRFSTFAKCFPISLLHGSNMKERAVSHGSNAREPLARAFENLPSMDLKIRERRPYFLGAGVTGFLKPIRAVSMTYRSVNHFLFSEPSHSDALCSIISPEQCLDNNGPSDHQTQSPTARFSSVYSDESSSSGYLIPFFLSCRTANSFRS